jgi:hypothetical protein
MSLANANILAIFDLLLLMAGSGYCLTMLLPRLGSRLLGPLAPNNISDRGGKWLAAVRGTAFGLTFFVIGAAGLFRDLGGGPTSSVSRYSLSLLIVITTVVGMAAHIRLTHR